MKLQLRLIILSLWSKVWTIFRTCKKFLFLFRQLAISVFHWQIESASVKFEPWHLLQRVPLLCILRSIGVVFFHVWDRWLGFQYIFVPGTILLWNLINWVLLYVQYSIMLSLLENDHSLKLNGFGAGKQTVEE